MWSRSRACRLISCLLLVALVSATTFADTIRLKDGSRIKGKIVAFGGGKFTVNIGDGDRKRQMSFDVEDVESIIFESTPPQTQVVATSNVPVRPQPTTTNPNRTTAKTTTKPPVTKRPEPTVSEVTDAPEAKPATPTRKVTYAKPIELAVKVHADNTANGWTNSGWIVKKGQRIRVIGTGEVSLGHGKTAGPSGLYDLDDKDKLLKSVPTGALIAVIGDDNNEFIYIGSEREFVASRDGALFLGLNEGNLNDNSGSFDVKIEIAPEGS